MVILLAIIKATTDGAIFCSDLIIKLGNIFVKISPEEIIKIAEEQRFIRITPVKVPEVFLRVVTVTKEGEAFIQAIR